MEGEKPRSYSTSRAEGAQARMCVSSRRRPITSPPGGGSLNSPMRADRGPATRMEARILRQRSGSRSAGLRSRAVMRHEVASRSSTCAPRLSTRCRITLHILDARNIAQSDRFFGQQTCSHQGQCGVFVSCGHHLTVQRGPAFDYEFFHVHLQGNIGKIVRQFTNSCKHITVDLHALRHPHI
jgi:hypothetical protein